MKKKLEKLASLSQSNFKKKEIIFDVSEIQTSRYDKSREIKLPTKLTPELAEEIGMHIGDGTLPLGKYNYSVRGDIAEKEYYKNHVQPLYKKVYGIETRLLERPPICGIEFDSKAIYQFKSKVLGLHIGEKKGMIRVPKQILESDDPQIYRALLRGINDTDGCFYMSPNRKTPEVKIVILSQPLIEELDFILKRLGFIPCPNLKQLSVTVSGPVLFHKWLTEIGSKNPKHLKRIHRIKSRLPWDDITTSIKEFARVV